jgi:hypothetical protein
MLHPLSESSSYGDSLSLPWLTMELRSARSYLTSTLMVNQYFGDFYLKQETLDCVAAYHVEC